MAAPAASATVDIGFTCTTEELFIAFEKLTNGSLPPVNVIVDNPYRYEPQNVPDDFWFLTDSNENIDMDHGFWKIKEEAREVFSNSDIIGWRATLEYYKGKIPYGQKTNWVMQVFRTTQKKQCDDIEKKENNSLCRVFLVPSDEMQQKVSTAPNVSESHSPQPPVLDANSSTRIGSSGNPQAVAERHPIPEHQGENNVMDFFTGGPNDHFSGGDFLELKDLDNPASFSISENSSTPSVTSDEYFELMAFLQDLDEDQVLEQNDAVERLNVSNRLDEVVIVPAPTAASLVSVDGSNSGSDEFLKTTSSVPNSGSGSRGLNNKVIKHAKGDQRGEGPSSSRKPSTSTYSHTAAAAGGSKRDAFGGMKKLRKKYLCFMPF